MTPTGYMTVEAWVEMAPKIADGIRMMPVISGRPEWWVLKIIDGYGAHTSSEAAMQTYADRKILLLKEEGDSSHVNQSYDQKVAKDDKKSMRQSLAYLRQSNKLTKGTIDGWALIHVALAAVRELDANSWVYSFDKVNLKPSTRVSFPEWIKRIEHYVQGGESFKPEIIRDPYALLSPFWHGMTPDEKKGAFAIFESHTKEFTVACIKELVATAHVPMSEMQNFRVAIEVAMRNPSHLERGQPDLSVLHEQPKEVQEAQANVASATAGLHSFQVVPRSADGSLVFSGDALFDHMCRMARRSVPHGQDLVPSATLNVEYTSTQQKLINPRMVDYAMHEIAKHAHGEHAKQAMARRKLDNLGYMRGESGLQNDEDRMARLKNQMNLMESMATINKETANTAATNASLAASKLIAAAPAALAKLKMGGGDPKAAKLTVAEMAAIAYTHFKGAVLKGLKDAHIKELSALIKQQPEVLQHVAAPARPMPLTSPPLVAPTATAPMPAAATTTPLV